MAETLEDHLVLKWKEQGLEPEDILTKLKMDKSADSLTSPQLRTLVEFMRTYNSGRDPKISLVKMLTDRFGDKDVAVALMKARNSNPQSIYVEELEKALMKR